MSALSCVRRRTPVLVFDQIKQALAPELLAEISAAFAELAANLSPAGLHRRQSCSLVYHERVWALLVQFI